MGRFFKRGALLLEHFGPFRYAEIIRSGRLGKIQTITVGVGGPSKWCDPAAEGLEPGLTGWIFAWPRPKRPYNSKLSPRGMHTHFPEWRTYREYAGGGHSDMGASLMTSLSGVSARTIQVLSRLFPLLILPLNTA